MYAQWCWGKARVTANFRGSNEKKTNSTVNIFQIFSDVPSLSIFCCLCLSVLILHTSRNSFTDSVLQLPWGIERTISQSLQDLSFQMPHFLTFIIFAQCFHSTSAPSLSISLSLCISLPPTISLFLPPFHHSSHFHSHTYTFSPPLPLSLPIFFFYSLISDSLLSQFYSLVSFFILSVSR